MKSMRMKDRQRVKMRLYRSIVPYKWTIYVFTLVSASLVLAFAVLRVPSRFLYALLTNDWGIQEFDDAPENFPHLLQLPRWVADCKDRPKFPEVEYLGNGFTALINYFPGYKDVACFNDVTLVIQAELPDLRKLPDLAEEYQSPISLAVYAPGEDFRVAVEYLVKLRACYKMVRKYITVHVFFPSGSVEFEADGVKFEERLRETLRYNCSTMAGFELPSHSARMERLRKLLQSNSFKINLTTERIPDTYPVNIGRNIAMEASTTYLVMISHDLSLIPRPRYYQMKLIQVIKMAKANFIDKKSPAVFVYPAFEVPMKKGDKLPVDKPQLKKLFNKNLTTIRALPTITRHNHRVDSVFWLNGTIPVAKENSKNEPAGDDDPSEGFFHLKKYFGKEGEVNSSDGEIWRYPLVYVAVAQGHPKFDERFSLEGGFDKHRVLYEMCVQNFAFYVLKDGFAAKREVYKARGESKGHQSPFEPSSAANHISGQDFSEQFDNPPSLLENQLKQVKDIEKTALTTFVQEELKNKYGPEAIAGDRRCFLLDPSVII